MFTGGHISAIRGIRGEFAGMKEAVTFLSFMRSSEKNVAIRKAYVIATKAYRKDLRANTPTNKTGHEGTGRTLKDTVWFAPSRKYSHSTTLVDPLWVGHMVKKGAYHQHLIVRGTKAWRQLGDTPLRRKSRKGKNAGTTKRRKFFAFKDTSGKVQYKGMKKAVKGKNYVEEIRDQHVGEILGSFSTSFIRGMKKEANKPKYKGYLSH